VADDPKSERLGVRGTFAVYDSALRLVGGASATGFLAAGAALHAFDKADIQECLKRIAILFVVGVLMFTFAYIGWFMTVIYIDWALQNTDEEAPEEVWILFPRVRTFEQNRRAAKRGFFVLITGGAASFVFFLLGLAHVIFLELKV
jgi:hypothetical protein